MSYSIWDWVKPARLLVVGALALIMLAGCFTDGDGDGGPEVVVADGIDATSEQLIAQALESGEIDEPTSLLYRTWLFFGDSLLPEEYLGAPAPHDEGFIHELRAKLDGLPEDIRAQVDSYLLRPADPASAFNAQAEPAASADQAASQAHTAAGLGSFNALPAAVLGRSGPEEEPEKKPQNDKKKVASHRCVTGWDTLPVPGFNFLIWSCKDADALPGISNADAMEKTVQIIAKYVPQMTADMGDFILDDPSKQTDSRADVRIDVYVMPTGYSSPRYENTSDTPGYAVTIDASPMGGKTTSSYMMVSTGGSKDQDLLERMVVHELFHALQRAHHAYLDAQWWVEGSAVWAASYYVRNDSARLHAARLPLRQNSKFSLATPRSVDDLGPYGAYLWPLYMEQEAGADAIFDTWEGLRSLPKGADNEQVIQVIGTQVDLPSHFAEFTMRTLNAKLDGDPIATRFVELDSHFPDGLRPKMALLDVEKEPLELGPMELKGLGHRFYDVGVEARGSVPVDEPVSLNIRSDLVTDSGVIPTLEALIRNQEGNYERRVIHYSGDGMDVCVSEHMLLALSNSAVDMADTADGTIVLTRNVDDTGEPVRCVSIEATHPEALSRLAENEVVKVVGTEADEQRDTVPIMVTVFGVPAKHIADYRVQVKLTGDTLASPRKFTWPLADFDVLVADTKYRKSVDVLLDNDLTFANRPLTIETRLIRKGDPVDTNAPTVELHGDVKSECSFEVTWSGAWSQNDIDAEFFPGPQEEGPMSGGELPQGEENPDSGYTSGSDAQSGNLPLVIMSAYDTGGMYISMDAQSTVWGGSLPAHSSPYLWTLYFGPEIYEPKTEHLDLPLILSENDVPQTGMSLVIVDEGGAHGYRGPASIDIREHEFHESPLGAELDGYFTERLVGTFAGTLTSERGDTVDATGTFSYVEGECGA